ncbi:FAD-binding oxidoreductase [Ornithinimicrobium avium]|uniref:FAD-binding protein n=1 Tax=Ornithinimicrobium avium TaxID=2283195 RepID=A0A345NJP0_9MICO|nr:FAD-linked oxidase C-terminal domain-containing protein [Ornithinimicrobium avium]AXH95248.1 FAD-binding protein [Ornithinimicrobium avium]
MPTPPALDRLVADLPADVVVTDPDRMGGYRFDRSQDPDAGVPLAVVRAESTQHVQTAVRWAAEHRVPIITRGAGTGLSGGSSALDGCLVVSTERMRRIEVDPATRTCTVQPGLLNSEVKAAAAAEGLWYPPDPSSFEICSIGGNVATNAGGLCCVKYGVTMDYVLGMTVVLVDGTAVTLGGPRVKDVAGLSLTKLFVGSEGTLGIVTEIVLRLLPQPRPATTLVATFPTVVGATASVVEITRTMRPSMLELMDGATINAVEDMTRMGLDRDAGALLVVQSDEPSSHAREELEAVAAVCERHGATEIMHTDDPDEGEAFVAARRLAIPAVERKGSLLLEDVGVPVPQLGALVEGVAGIAEDNGVLIAVVAHAGDGNTHPLLVFDPADADQTARARTAYGQVMELAISLGGTITGEHGVGRLKKPWLASQLGPEAMELNHRIKAALDPHGLLNPGTVFESRGTPG